jgi:putative oxidoreductase
MSQSGVRFLDLGLLWIRVLMGSGMAYHGFGKVFGGHMAGFAAGVAKMGLPFPEAAAWAAALSEFVGGILIVLGFKVRIAAFFVFSTMTVAAFVRHAADPFSVKELALCYWTMAGMLILTGGGKFNLDR